MNLSRPARCLLSGRLAAAVRPAPTSECRAAFHASAQLNKRKPRFKNVRASDMGIMTPDQITKFTEQQFPAYTPEELEILSKKYTPEQMEALKAGEAAIDPRDLTMQGRIRLDPYRLPYLDDFSQHLPVVDKRFQKNLPPAEPASKWMSLQEMAADTDKWSAEVVPEHLRHLLNDEGIEAADMQAMEEMRERGMGDEEVEREMKFRHKDRAKSYEQRMKPLNEWLAQHGALETEKYAFRHGMMTHAHPEGTKSSVAPELGGEIPGTVSRSQKTAEELTDEKDENGQQARIKRRTGLDSFGIKSIGAKILATRHVTNQTRLGKVQRMYAIAVAGDGNGRLGVGDAKSVEPTIAMAKAKLMAIQNLQPVKRYEKRTIYGNVEAKFGSTIVKIEARPPGFGLRASHRLFEIFRLAGFHDLAAKMPRGRKPMNQVKACVEALLRQHNPEELAIGRGKKLVDVRNVYYGGQVF